jgi:hypothetical protein
MEQTEVASALAGVRRWNERTTAMRVPSGNNLINPNKVRLPKISAITRRAVQGLREVRDVVAKRGDAQAGQSMAMQRLGVARLPGEGMKVLATVWEQTLRPFGAADAAEIRLTVYMDRDDADRTPELGAEAGPGAKVRAADLVPHLRWLLTESTGTIADVAHQLETRANEVGDNARAQLRDDVSVLAEELATVKALLGGFIDWDYETKRLLAGEIPPLEPDDRQDVGDGEDR